MARDEDVMVLNDYGLTERTRTNKSGAKKSRYTVTIKSEPLLVNTNPRDLGRGPAEAIAQHLRDSIAGITTIAAPNTLRARKTAERGITKASASMFSPKMAPTYGPVREVYGPTRKQALMPDGEWARKRYSGGRMGLMLPNQSDRAFNDSGRFRDSIVVGPKGDGWVVNVAANRLDPTTTDGLAGLQRITQRLRELVPAWGDAKELMSVLSVRRAVKDALGQAIQKSTERGVALKKQLMSKAFGLLRMVA